jgi:hypothetical protein
MNNIRLESGFTIAKDEDNDQLVVTNSRGLTIAIISLFDAPTGNNAVIEMWEDHNIVSRSIKHVENLNE